jgi:hypothetical protein
MRFLSGVHELSGFFLLSSDQGGVKYQIGRLKIEKYLCMKSI